MLSCPPPQAYGRDPLAILRESLLSPGASPRSLAARRVGRASTELEAFLQEAGTHLPGAHMWMSWMSRLRHWGPIHWSMWPRDSGCCSLNCHCPPGVSHACSCAQGAAAGSPVAALHVHSRHSRLPPEQHRLPWLARGRAWLVAALPATEQQLRIALQFLLCFLAVMFLQIVDASYTALRTRVTWAVSTAGAAGTVGSIHGCAC